MLQLREEKDFHVNVKRQTLREKLIYHLWKTLQQKHFAVCNRYVQLAGFHAQGLSCSFTCSKMHEM